jgi:hypothetical protein
LTSAAKVAKLNLVMLIKLQNGFVTPNQSQLRTRPSLRLSTKTTILVSKRDQTGAKVRPVPVERNSAVVKTRSSLRI